ncbi:MULTISPECIES: hypothetical protein [unclassified Clostridium]|uniref:hypothetical protein n=1 Tax=unclassified Clostridium TaxID=2614128 RepID=UPI002A75DCAF|nr:hypothetical protein [Clostridium sp.]MDY2632724.1 hypothetical protein [Clostridium sp.]MDY4253481.1 hypothetical protein [Clostridium sp.]
MFRLNNKKENINKVVRQNKENEFNEKPRFKDLVSIMISQYLVILPVVFVTMIVLMLIAKLLLFIWGN